MSLLIRSSEVDRETACTVCLRTGKLPMGTNSTNPISDEPFQGPAASVASCLMGGSW